MASWKVCRFVYLATLFTSASHVLWSGFEMEGENAFVDTDDADAK
jgi:hypothetical protein